jgi:hypothetical protein
LWCWRRASRSSLLIDSFREAYPNSRNMPYVEIAALYLEWQSCATIFAS